MSRAEFCPSTTNSSLRSSIRQLERNHEKEMAAIEKKKGKDIKNATSRAEQRVEAKIKELKRKHEEKLKDIEDEYSEEVS